MASAVTCAVLLGSASVAEAKPKAKEKDPKPTTSCVVAGSYSDTGTIGSLYNINAAIGADQAWADGHTGEGIDVALIDTGVAPVAGLDAPGKIVNGPDFSLEAGYDEARHLDTYGHGTHLAGIIAGNDTDTAVEVLADGEFQGVAPDSRIVNLKVADYRGAVDVSQVIAAIDWAVANRNRDGLNIRVINLSYRTPTSDPYEVDPLARAVENAWEHGIVVVVAAGNDGHKTKRLPSPAHDPYVIAVSAAYDKEQEKSHCLDGKLKWKTAKWASDADKKNRQPDLSAPGATIVSLRNPGSFADQRYPDSAVSDRHTKATGTSQSAAVVSGAVAVLLQARPELTPDEVKAILIDSSDGKEKVVDVDKAIGAKVPKGAEQDWEPSSGTGSLEAARGGQHIELHGQPLTGENTIFGVWTPDQWLTASAQGAAWTGSSWSGSSWSGSSWSGSSWSGSSWSGSSWSGSSWSGSSWSGSSWSGSSWSGSSWSGSSWSGSSWSGSSWTGSIWS